MYVHFLLVQPALPDILGNALRKVFVNIKVKNVNQLWVSSAQFNAVAGCK